MGLGKWLGGLFGGGSNTGSGGKTRTVLVRADCNCDAAEADWQTVQQLPETETDDCKPRNCICK